MDRKTALWLFSAALLLLVITAPANAMWWTCTKYPGDRFGSTFTMAVYNGKLYAGAAAGNGTVYVYDGNSWNVSYDHAGHIVWALAVYDNKLYAGSDWGVYVYDGLSWTISDPLFTTRSLAAYKDKLYAGSNGGIFAYNGTSWNIVSEVGFGSNNYVDSLAVYNNKLYASTGEFGYIYVYDGTSWTWSYHYSASENKVHPLKVYNDKLYAGTEPNGIVYVYDGNSWNVSVGPSPHGYITAMEVYDSKLYTAWTGSPHLLVYDGISWNASEDSLHPLSFAVYNNKLYSAGSGMGVCEASFIQPTPTLSTNATSTPTQTPSQTTNATAIPTTIPILVITPNVTATPTATPTGITTVTATPAPTPKPTPCQQVTTYATNPEGKNCRQFSRPCDIPKNWIVVDTCPTPTLTSTPTPVQCSNGCLYGDSCIPFGTRLGPQYSVVPFNGSASYCEVAKKAIEPQKADGVACQNSYECVSNYCSNGVCGNNLQKELQATRGRLDMILDFLKKLFGLKFAK